MDRLYSWRDQLVESGADFVCAEIVAARHSNIDHADHPFTRGRAVQAKMVGWVIVTSPMEKTNSLGMPLIRLAEKTWLGAWPTRVQDFAAFVAATQYDATSNMLTLGKDDIDWLPHGHTWESPGFVQGPDHPVVGVSYEDALAFCAWLTEREGQSYGLPSDLEWSLAVGLGEETGASPEERLYHSAGTYPWGPAWPPPPDFGNYAGGESRVDMPSWWGVAPGGYVDGYPRTSPVGSFAPNRLGFYDLSGNVWEWCGDAYCPGSLARIVRGGSWGSDRPAYLQSANRNPKFPDSRNDETGFRVALRLR